MEQVDRLAQLRAEMRALKQEAKQIRQRLLTHQEPLIGERYVAAVRRQVVLRPITDANVERATVEPRTESRSNGARSYDEMRREFMVAGAGASHE